jgi:excisionase family DNA binding protein
MDDRSVKTAESDYIGTSYAARLLGLSVGTIQALVEKGELEAWRTKGGHRRISMSSLRAYQAEHGVSSSHASADEPYIRVLVVDDDAAMREMMGDLIAKWKLPIDCTLMSSAMEALIDIHTLRPDVLFTDLNMPGVDGIALLRTLRSNAAFDTMLLVAITGLAPEAIEERGGLPANTVVVEKPVRPAWLQGFLTALATQRMLPART